MRSIGVAFGGGGARGLAHIGVLSALRENAQYLPSVVAGTSVGSVVAALYGCGLGQEEMEEAAKKFD